VSAQRWPAVRSKSNTALTQYVKRFPSTTTQQMLFHQWISEPLNVNQVISGTISMVVKTYEGNAAVDSHLAFILKVMQGDSTTLVRGTLLQYHATSTEKTTAWQTRIHSARAITTVNALAGDRIVIEIGSHGVTPSTAYDDGLKFGDPSATADYALTSGLTTDLVPWVELSATLTFGNPPVELAGSVAAQATASGALTVQRPLAGVVSASSALAGAAQAQKLLAGALSAASQASGAILKSVALAGEIAALSGAQGDLLVTSGIRLGGTVLAEAGLAAALRIEHPLAGGVSGVSVLSASILKPAVLAGGMPAVSLLSAALQQQVHLVGLAAAEALIVGDLSVGAAAELAGIVAAASGLSAALLVEHVLTGAIPAESSLAGALEIVKPLAGGIAGLSALAGAIRVVQAVKLSGTVAAMSAAVAVLYSPVEVSGDSLVTVAVRADSTVTPAAAGESIVTSQVLGNSRVT
jgi:hypothetical protein